MIPQGAGRCIACFIVICGLLAASPQARPDAIVQCAALLEEYSVELPASDEKSVECTIPVDIPPLFEACPEQVTKLLRHPWSGGLARDTDELVLADLEGLDLLEQHYASIEPRALLRTTDVAGILEELALPEPRAPSLWERFLRWLKTWFQSQDTDINGIFENISFSELTLKAIMFTAIGLIILLALIILGSELRVALRNRRNAQTVSWQEGRATRSDTPDFDLLARAPLRDQPGILLEIILAQLQSSGILRLRSSCTHRDISAAATTLNLGDGLDTISSAAERATFGNWDPAEQDMAALLETGRGISLAIEGAKQ